MTEQQTLDAIRYVGAARFIANRQFDIVRARESIEHLRVASRSISAPRRAAWFTSASRFDRDRIASYREAIDYARSIL